MVRLKTRQKLGKYRIEGRLGEGGFATVYRAYDTIEGVRVALKIPHPAQFKNELMNQFLKEVRIVARLEHPNILPLKTAGYIDDRFVMVQPLGKATLGDRMSRRLAPRTALSVAEQLLDAVSFAHKHRVIHCDIKPENVILFDDGRVKLADFGIAKVALRTRQITADGTGTIGYLAPEQAFGKPSFRSDVFSMGLLIYRMLSGSLPEWPYDWPPPGYERLRKLANPAFVEFLEKAMAVDDRDRFGDAVRMRSTFLRIKPRALRASQGSTRPRRSKRRIGSWKTARVEEFQRAYKKDLETRYKCRKCRGPFAESMLCCPWCGHVHKKFQNETTFPSRCTRCGRGAKLDWPFCRFCYGGKIQEPSARSYSDKRYQRRCASCRGDLIPFSRYCPWCRSKVKTPWSVPHSRKKCRKCRWGVAGDFWSFCPWCGTGLTAKGS